MKNLLEEQDIKIKANPTNKILTKYLQSEFITSAVYEVAAK
jgi:hypothetical protein